MAKTITLLCPNLVCRAILTVPDKVRGKKIRCGKCGTNFVVPGASPVKASASDATSAQPVSPNANQHSTG
ncbi:MAG: hypothetical protein HOP29_17040 [Phycisphaerales bacterium]|nr:hypothetical protein [Phycisphaerales bacterium]